MKFVKVQWPVTNVFSASATVQTVIGQQSYWITALQIDYLLTFNTGTSSSYRQDWLHRDITAFNLRGRGRNYLSINGPDMRVFYWHNRMRLRGRNRAMDARAADSQTDSVLVYSYMIPFDPDPIGPDDSIMWHGRPGGNVVAAIPPDPDLTFQVTWGVLGTTSTTTIWGVNVAGDTATALRFTLHGVVFEAGDKEPGYFPIWQTSQWAPSQTYAGLSGVQYLPSGFMYRRSTNMILNGASPSDYRADGLLTAAISEVGLRAADGRNLINAKTVTMAQASQAQFQVADDNTAAAENGSMGTTASYGVAVATAPFNPGVYDVDYTRYSLGTDPRFGVDLTNAPQNSLGHAFTVDTATNTNVVRLDECYQRL